MGKNKSNNAGGYLNSGDSLARDKSRMACLLKKIVSLLCAVLLIFPSINLVGIADSEFIIEDGTLVSYGGSSNVVTIPAGVYRIGEDAFYGKTFITAVNFPDTILSIGRRAFRDCTGLTSIRIPSLVTLIATDAFSGCLNLSEVILNDYVTTIGAGAFQNCPVTSINIPYSLRNLGVRAFNGHKMTHVTLPSTVVAIGDFAFGDDGNSIIIRGVPSTSAHSFAETFHHKFEAITEPNPLPILTYPDVEMPPEMIHDGTGNTEIYMGTGEKPADYAIPAANYLMRNTGIDDEYYNEYKNVVSREECAYYLIHIYYTLLNRPIDLNSGASPFSDTDSRYVTKARELSLVNGTDSERNLFSPYDPVTREQMTAYFIRLLNICGIPYNQGSVEHIFFNDHENISGWALPDIRRAYFLGLINGTGNNNMSPQNNITKEQVFTMLYNLLTNLDRIKNMLTRGEDVRAPQLMYYGIGRHPEGHIDEAYYSSPSIVDINGDGRLEIISSAYSIYCTDAQTGNINWQIPSGFDRNTPAQTMKPAGRAFADIITKDIDNDGSLEIVTGHSFGTENNVPLGVENWRGIVAVYNREGYFKPGWPKQLPKPVTSVVAHDLNGDGICEIVVGTSGAQSTSVWVFDSQGNIMDGWPQLNNWTDATKNNDFSQNTGYQYGIFNNNIAVGDITGDGVPEIVVPSDLQFICVYDMKGNLIKANSLFGGRSWGRVGTWEDYEFEKLVENEGWGNGIDWQTGLPIDLSTLPREQRNCAIFTNNKALIQDVDGDGSNEVVVIGTISDRALMWPELPLYETPFIFNGDRTRFKTDKFDWTSVPKDTGKILTMDWLEMELCAPSPVVTDIDFNGVNDIIYPSASGQVLCFSLDKLSSWSYWVCDQNTKEIASPVEVMDLNGDGLKEVIFTTIAAKKSMKPGSLVILDSKGKEIHRITLPESFDASGANGSISRPVIADIDGDGRLEIILNTYLSGLTVYKI